MNMQQYMELKERVEALEKRFEDFLDKEEEIVTVQSSPVFVPNKKLGRPRKYE